MQGMIISNPKLEFLRPVLERWFDCIDRYNACLLYTSDAADE